MDEIEKQFRNETGTEQPYSADIKAVLKYCQDYINWLKVKIINLSERSEPPHPLLEDGWRLFEKSNMPNNGETVYLCLYRDNRTIEEPCPHQEFEYYVGINENDRDSINIGRFYIYKYDQFNLLFWKRIVPPSVI